MRVIQLTAVYEEFRASKLGDTIGPCLGTKADCDLLVVKNGRLLSGCWGIFCLDTDMDLANVQVYTHSASLMLRNDRLRLKGNILLLLSTRSQSFERLWHIRE